VSATEEFYKSNILGVLTGSKKITLSELSKRLKKPKSTIFRWVSLFKAQGLIQTEYIGKKNKKGRELLIKKSPRKSTEVEM